MSAARIARVAAVSLVLAFVTNARPAAAAVASQVPVGARAVAMGGAYTSLAEDASALFWNPAGLARIGHQEVGASHANLFRSGIVDNLAGFVLPLSPSTAVATDWYHSGFDDGELGFGENRVTVAWASRVAPGLWAGVGGKWLSRSLSLDGLDLTSAHGLGVDAGLLASPVERLRLGLVLQDATGTRVRGSEGEAEVAYPRNLRAGVSYAARRWGTAAFDIDDRWHLGAETQPLPQLALRGGVERDRHGREDATWTWGAGIAQGILRVDWAHVEPPVLAGTDHFSVAFAFNFNPAQIRVEKVAAHELYSSLYQSYAGRPFGSVQLRNLQDRPLDARLRVYIPELMTGPSEQSVVLRPKASQEFPLTAVLDERVLAQRGDRPVQVTVSALYQSRRLERSEKAIARTVAYAPGAIDWSAGMDQAAAFVTPRDPAVEAVAREAARRVADAGPRAFGSRNIAFAAAVTDALAELGVTYVPDPTNPFASMSETAHAVDTINYPFQTLARLAGDCDDSTVLTASLLANLGVATRFVDAPGHIFLAYDTGLHVRHRDALGVDTSMTVVLDDEVWAPLETTALSKGFAEAWRIGADEVASWAARGQIGYVDVTDAQGRYEPANPPGERPVPRLGIEGLDRRLAADAAAIRTRRDEWFAAHFGAPDSELVASAGALAEIARVDYLGGDLAGAREQLVAALARAPQSVPVHNDLGVVLAAQDSLAAAIEHWDAALALGGADPGIRLNLGLARAASGDSAAAVPLLARAVADAGGVRGACRLLGLAESDSLERADGDGAAASGRWVRERLRTAAAPGSERAARRGPSAGTPLRENHQLPSPEWRLYLYWIE